MNTNQPAVYDPLTRTLHWLTVAGFIGIPTTIVLWTNIGINLNQARNEAADSTNSRKWRQGRTGFC
ncbi:putative cytochrome B561 [Neisseria meningitidis]|uniref:hypothetical protein n=1 Tax=Neisseria meningitidis TaxID=487 RepID=UPI0005E3E741|nr:hypothetical protein [Neisseria meningitidis]CKL27007.1 putative cytochrome B561 [Neisseria meningitidis]